MSAVSQPPTFPSWPPAGWDELVALLPDGVRRAVLDIPAPWLASLRELRLRSERPLVGVFGAGPRYISPTGRPATSPSDAYRMSAAQATAFLVAVTRASVYAHERELQEGFLTLPGGHRVGFAGEALMDGARLRTLRHVGSFNVRIAREVMGAADRLLPRLLRPSGRPAHTLIVSPPGCGKTTLVRDVARRLSDGSPTAGPGWRVTIIDERSELAACEGGVPQLHVGANTDVLYGVPKAVGVWMALRSLGPDVIVTDEVGGENDVAALADAQRGGVSVIATAHGDRGDVHRLAAHPELKWQRIVRLSDRRGPGTVEEVKVISAGTSQ